MKPGHLLKVCFVVKFHNSYNSVIFKQLIDFSGNMGIYFIDGTKSGLKTRKTIYTM